MKNKKWIIIFLVSLLSMQNIMGQIIQTSRNDILDVDTQVKDKSLLVKCNDIESILGLMVEVDNKRKNIIIRDLGNRLDLTLESKKAIFNGEALQTAISPITKEGIIYVPLQFIADVFCYQLEVINGRLVVRRNILEETMNQLIKLEDYLGEYLIDVEGLLDDYEWIIEKRNSWFTEAEYKKTYKEQSEKLEREISRIILEIKNNQSEFTPMAKILSNQEIALCNLVKDYIKITPWDKEKKRVAYEKAATAFNDYDLEREMIGSGYYGYESIDTIADIEVTFDVANEFIYVLDQELKADEHEIQNLMLKAKKERLQYIKAELKEDEIIKLVDDCIDVIDRQLSFIQLYKEATIKEKPSILKKQQALFEEAESVERQLYRYSDVTITNIDDTDLSGEGQEAISAQDSERLFTYRYKILDLANQLDVIGVKYVAGYDIKNECNIARQLLKELVKEYDQVKEQLQSEASKSYLILKKQVLDQSQIILDELQQGKIDNKGILYMLNQLEELSNSLSLGGHLVYKEIIE